ncbi:MAG: transporter substrate-binding domain-containing protein [Marinobacter sp.]|nr:transporter substrate-binding domain-containing protein [Marinobacter sp.]
MFKPLVLFLLLLCTACSPDDPPAAVPERLTSDTVPASQPSSADTPESVVVLAADPWCPHNCVAGSEQEGYMVDIAREAFARVGLTVRYVNMSWARALYQAEAGEIDGVIGAFTGDAPGFLFPEKPAGHSRTELFTHPDSTWVYSGIDSLRNQTLLAINGYSYSPELDAYIAAHLDDPERVLILSGPSPLSRAIQLIWERRTDVFPEDREVMNWAQREHPSQGRLRSAARIYESPIYIAFSPQTPTGQKRAEQLSEGIRALEASGRIGQIMARYGIDPPEFR